MPSYNYKCKKCGDIHISFRSIADRNKPSKCICGGKTKLGLSAPFVFPDATDRFARNHEIEGNGIRSSV
jgi:putative FmdB family regulatory protein